MPASLSCKLLKQTWLQSKPAGIAANPRYLTDPVTGKPLLMFVRNNYLDNNDYAELLLAEVDGPVHFTLRMNDYMKRRWSPGNLSKGRYVLYATAGDTAIEGWAGAERSDPYSLVSQTFPHEGVFSSAWYLVGDTLVQRKDIGTYGWPWNSSSNFLIYNASLDPDGLPATQGTYLQKDLFLQVGGLKMVGVVTWNKEQGARALLRWPGDYTRGASNLGTDGHDMVWTQGQGKAPNDDNYPTRDIFTAPFSTDAATLNASARRLRSDPSWMSAYNYVVGCGYAAHTLNTPEDISSAIIVRLSDGASWKLQGGVAVDKVSWSIALGVTCEEVFFIGAVGNLAYSFLRVRLDSLGPPIAPD